MYMSTALNNNPIYMDKDEDYKEVFETSKTGIVHLDSNMRIKSLNREAEKICGVDRMTVLGQLANVVFQNYGDKFLRIFAMPDYDDFYTTNLKLNIMGKANYIHVDTLKIRDAAGEVSGIVVMMQDVSAVRAAIKQIQTTQMLMSLGELAAGVAHHVRTPLTTISGYLQVMLSRVQDGRHTVRRDVLETMLDEVSYINNVVKELVLFAKPPVDKSPGVSINKLVDEALLLVFKEMGGENVILDKQLATNLVTLNADANLLKQAIVNIMQNAIEAMPEKGILSVKTWIHADGNMLVVAVSDTGAGIAPEILPRIFEPFYTTKLDRMGLGLPIAYRIIGEHGGFMNISLDEKGGTKVHIYLPLIDSRTRRLSIVHQQVLNLQ